MLIHGAPGTGKSQLVRVIGQILNIPVLELDTADNDGDPLRAYGRLSVLNLAQTYFHEPAVLLVFDEAEGILTPSITHPGMANSHKGLVQSDAPKEPPARVLDLELDQNAGPGVFAAF